MPSLENRVASQRDTLIAHGPGIRLYAKRVHKRLAHPVLLIPAFLGGILVARVTPELLRKIPELNVQAGLVTEQLSNLYHIVQVIGALTGESVSNRSYRGELPAAQHCRQYVKPLSG